MITETLRIINATVCTAIANGCAFEAVRNGTTVCNSRFCIDVADGCCGTGYATAAVALAAASALIYKGSIWAKFAMIMLAIPLAVSANILRIIIIFMVGSVVKGDSFAWVHDFLGYALFSPVVFGIVRMSKKIERFSCLLIISLAVCFADNSCAQTSNVQVVRAWTRTHVMGIPGGGLLDPTGTLADAQRLAAANAVINDADVLVAAAHTGLTNALDRLYSAAARTNDFTGRLFIAADLDDDPGYSNVWSAVVGESVGTNGTLHYFCHYSRELAAPPKTRWAFEIDGGMTLWSDGVVATNNVLTNVNGYACYDISVTRPEGVGGSVLRANKFMRFGTPDTPLGLNDAGFQIITNATAVTPFTGSDVYTNVTSGVSNRITDIYLSGLLYTTTTNLIGGAP